MRGSRLDGPTVSEWDAWRKIHRRQEVPGFSRVRVGGGFEYPGSSHYRRRPPLSLPPAQQVKRRPPVRDRFGDPYKFLGMPVSGSRLLH